MSDNGGNEVSKAPFKLTVTDEKPHPDALGWAGAVQLDPIIEEFYPANTDLLSSLARLEAVVAKAVPAPWWIDGFDIMSSRVVISTTEDGGKDRYLCKGDISEWKLMSTAPQLGDIPVHECIECSEAIVALRNCAEEMLDVVIKAHLMVCPGGMRTNGSAPITDLKESLAALGKKLEGIL